jgi:hypothetical protein
MRFYSRLVLVLLLLGLLGPVSAPAYAADLGLGLGVSDLRQRGGGFGSAGLDFDFQNSNYYQLGQAAGTPIDSRVTTSRASVAYEDDLSGNWTSFGNNVLRVTNKGALIEEARTNSIRNNSMQGAVAGVVGSGGALPTNWFPSFAGLTITVGSPAVLNGIDVIDIRFSGTTGGTFGVLEFDTNAGAATYGQTWSNSAFLALTGGNFTNVTLANVQLRFNVGTIGGPDLRATLTSALARYSATGTPTNSGTTTAVPSLNFAWSSGVAVDFTLRIGWPQAENNSINSSVVSATANANGSGYGNTLTGTMTWAGAGCPTNPVLNVTSNAGGAIVTVNSVPTPGSCTTFPPAGATTWTPGGGLSAGTLATFNLTPTDNSAQGFPTSPIRTTAAAATRAADVVTVTNVPASLCVPACTLLASGLGPLGGTKDGTLFSVGSDGNNFLETYHGGGSGGTTECVAKVGGSFIWTGAGGASSWAANTAHKEACAYAVADHALIADGATANTDATAGTLPAATIINIGTQASLNDGLWNGYIRRVSLWPTLRLPNATLQNLTQ